MPRGGTWAERPKNVKLILFLVLLGGAVFLLALLAADLLIARHGHFAWEEKPGFMAAAGFLACAGLVLFARLVRFLAGRSEDYYDR